MCAAQGPPPPARCEAELSGEQRTLLEEQRAEFLAQVAAFREALKRQLVLTGRNPLGEAQQRSRDAAACATAAALDGPTAETPKPGELRFRPLELWQLVLQCTLRRAGPGHADATSGLVMLAAATLGTRKPLSKMGGSCGVGIDASTPRTREAA
jgi:hypothetical protein